MIKKYKIKGTYWFQGDLMYPEALEVFALTRGRLKGIWGDWPAIGRLIDAFADDHTLDKIFAVALKPYEPTPLHRWRNRRNMARHDITRANIIQHMTARQVAQASLDFFFINAGLIRKFLNIRVGSISLFQRGPTLLQAILSILKLSSTLPAATISKQKHSATSEPST